MTNLIEVTTNKILNEMVDQAIREAIHLQRKADTEHKNQCERREAGQEFNFALYHAYVEGARGLGQALQKLFGGYPAHIHRAIEKLSKENHDICCSVDFVNIFIKALEDGSS